MGLIEKELEVEGYKNRKVTKTKASVLFDTGSTVSFVRKDIAERLSDILPFPHDADLGAKDKKMKVEGLIGLTLKINGVNVTDAFWVTEELRQDIVVGASTMQARRLILDMKKEDIDVSKFMPITKG